MATGGGAGAPVSFSMGRTMFPPRLRGAQAILGVTGKLLRIGHQRRIGVRQRAGPTSENDGELTSVDDDHAIAFANQSITPKPTRKPTKNIDHQDVRVLDVTSRGSDLLADSRRLVAGAAAVRVVGRSRGRLTFWEGVFVAADGKTVVCTSLTGPTGRYHPGQHWTVRWLTYSTAAPTVARVLNTVTISVPNAGSFALNEQPLSGPSAAIIAVWYFFAGDHPAVDTRVAVVSAGKLRLLPTKLVVSDPVDGFPAIAW